MTAFLAKLGDKALASVRSLGQIVLLLWRCAAAFFTGGLRYRRETVAQFYFIGVQSLPVVLTTGAFAGAVFAYTLYNQFANLGVESWTGALVLKMMTWHLGPVLMGLVLAGRVGCSITAEIGTMKVTEQVDAMRTMGVEPIAYLALPRLLAAFFMMPVLTAIAIFTGIATGLVMIVGVMGGEMHFQINQIRELMVSYDYAQALSKAAVFGILIAVISCKYGLETSGGAEGVGKATTTANVSICIAILVVNMGVSVLLNHAEPWWNEMVNLFDSLVAYFSG